MNKITDSNQSSRIKYGIMSSTITIAVIGIISLIYAISIILHDKYDLSIDMTFNKVFDMSQESKDFLKELNKDITINVLSTEQQFDSGEEYHRVAHTLKTYSRLSPKIHLNYLDIVKNPMIVEKYKEENVNYRSVIIEHLNKFKILNMEDLFDMEFSYSKGNRIIASKAEQAITSAIMEVSSDQKLKICILTGHDGGNTQGIEKLLKDNLYDVCQINLLTSDIPKDTSMVIIASPTKDYTKEELNKLSTFLDNDGNYGKNIFYFAHPGQPDLPNINSFLAEWDIAIDRLLVLDESRQTQLHQFSSTVEYSDQEFFKSLVDKDSPTVFISSNPIRFINQETTNKTHNTLLNFSAEAVGLKYTESSIEPPEQATAKGPFVAIAKSTKYNDAAASSVIVSGSIMSADMHFLFALPIGNAEAYLKIVNNACEKKDIGIDIVSTNLRGDEINIQENVARIIGTVCWIIPIAVLIFGIVVWKSRRHK